MNNTSHVNLTSKFASICVAHACICVVCLLSTFSVYAQKTPGEYVKKGWALSGEGKFQQVYQLMDKCIAAFAAQADEQAKTLKAYPLDEHPSPYQVMIDVATCYFIKAEAMVKEGKQLLLEGKEDQAHAVFLQAKEIFLELIEKYPFAKAWDERGWYWSLQDAARETIGKIDRREVVKMGVEKPQPLQEESRIILHDTGSEFPVDYEKYGEFHNPGTKEYTYKVTDPIGLSKAVGEGIYPNTSSVKFDPAYVQMKKSLSRLNHWEVLNSRDLKTAFYKWNFSPEPPGVKQFYIADILERSGLIKHAVKAYYAVLVHYPYTVGWTYWQTPWYIGKVALYRLRFLLAAHSELGLKLEGASLTVANGYDNDIRNDEFIVNPGRLVKKSFLSRLCSGCQRRKTGTVVETRGKGFVKLVRYETGDWQLLVHDKPFMVKGITYGPTRVGESPDEGTLNDWTRQDINKNGLIDAPYESWVDRNGNNLRDKNEKIVGDFQLLKDMGVNSIRLYHQPHKPDKKLLGQMYKKYGIFVQLGDFLGKYAIGSGASWEEGTDYDNPQHQENMLNSVRQMVLEYRDEPYILMWILGNENVYGLGCNANKKPTSFFKFANRAAQLVKSLDPLERPVLIVSGDVLFLDVFAKECPDIDIFGSNAYRGKYGFFGFWDSVKQVSGKPAMITEYGCSSYSVGYSDEEGQAYQAEYHRNAWNDIKDNSCGFGAGNAVGGIAFEWIDEWWKRYEPYFHDRTGQFAGPFLDGYMHEEWLGVCSQGKGRESPFLRQLKKAYFTYQELWN